MKVGRNQPCPCGSGKKFKRCHGSVEQQDQLAKAIRAQIDNAQVREVQRERQQGRGRPIISAEAMGYRFVAVNNRLHYSATWKTFHDFLGDYIRTVLTPEWGNVELAKPFEERHPILVWYHHVCDLQRRYVKTPGEVYSGRMTGAVAAYMHLAYDLYALAHNAELQQKLIERLRDKDNFEGAQYEVQVAAILIRAGFDVEFENEDDRSSSHCEFTATHRRTGRKFSVEAKHRSPDSRLRLGRQLMRALAKEANYDRIVFIESNVPDDSTNEDGPPSLKLDRTLAALRRFENRTFHDGGPLPPAYLCVTNMPWQHHLADERWRCSAIWEGFKIPDFKSGVPTTLRSAVDARERHIEIHELMKSMEEHSEIPSTFDAEIPEFAFGNDTGQRLLIGHYYLVPTDGGVEKPGRLIEATVNESAKTAHCILAFDDGTPHHIVTWPLSEREMAAWRKHPDTFFGDLRQRSQKAETALELYDFFLGGYKNTPRERLLELMAAAPDFGELRMLTQPQLASVYAERCTYHALQSVQPAT